MSNDDKLKNFLDQNLKKEFNKPASEFAEIVEKIDQESSGWSWLQLSSMGMAGVATALMVVLLWPGTQPSEMKSPESPTELSEFLIDSQYDLDEDDDFEDNAYLALIE